MKRKRKIFRTPEERKAWEARSEARIRDLQSHIDRITAELAAKKRPPADPAPTARAARGP
jgi:hypothetical protein